MSQSRFLNAFLIVVLAGGLAAPMVAAEQAAAPEAAIAVEQLGNSDLTVAPQIAYETAVLSVVGPEGYEVRRKFGAGATPSIELFAAGLEQLERVAATNEDLPNPRRLRARAPLPDGQYLYELTVVTSDGQSTRQGGMFFVEGGRAVGRDQVRERLGRMRKELNADLPAAGAPSPTDEPVPLVYSTTDWISVTDGSTDGDTAINFDTDVYTTGANYWSVGTDNGIFRVDDQFTASTFSTTPAMTLTAPGLDMGVGTSAPAFRLEVADSTPKVLRLTTGTVNTTFAAGEAAFAIYDDDDQFPFVIEHSAGSNQIWIDDGGVGINNSGPEAQLHVVDPVPGGNAAIVQSGALQIKRTDGPPANIRFSTANRSYLFANNQANQTFEIRDENAAQSPFIIFPSAGAGVLAVRNSRVGINLLNPLYPVHHVSGARLTVGGIWTNASSRALKTGFQAVESELMLSRLMELPVESWTYKAEENGARHVGPVAEDFQRIFGLGDGESIATSDADGVMLAAIQALKRELDAKDSELEALRKEIEALKEALQVD